MSNHDAFVTYGPETDAVYAIYIGGVLHASGDDYHTKLSHVSKGWCDCLRWLGRGDDISAFDVPASKCRGITDEGDSVPKKWPNKFTKHATQGRIP